MGFGLCIPVICLLPLFYFHMLGAGDIKLLAVTGAFLGWKSLVVCFMGALFVGGIISVYKMCRYHIFQKRFAYFSHYMKMYLKTGCVKPYYDSSLEAWCESSFFCCCNYSCCAVFDCCKVNEMGWDYLLKKKIGIFEEVAYSYRLMQ